MFALTQLASHLRRRQRARRLGIDYTRSATWRLPPRALINGKEWLIRAPQDEGTRIAFFDIFLNDCYGIEKAGRGVKTVLDVGAHAGLFSMHARNIFPEALIHAYEPNPQLAEFLAHQSRVGGFTYHPQAVGRGDGFVRLDLRGDSVQTRTHPVADGPIEQVAFRMCVERLGGRVDVLKMDCEGAEWDLLGDDASLAAVRYVGMEFHLVNGHTREEIAFRMKRLGFHVLRLTENSSSHGLLWAVRN